MAYTVDRVFTLTLSASPTSPMSCTKQHKPLESSEHFLPCLRMKETEFSSQAVAETMMAEHISLKDSLDGTFSFVSVFMRTTL